MKKVININFQGRVIPIEENAYDLLKNYVESLRKHFANEEGRDEIINDIEGRIAELFGETLKKGSTCISEEDVNTIIASMGRPEDFDDEEANVKSQLSGEEKTSQNQYNYQQSSEIPRGRLYRDENDKIVGGVCSGIAAYLRVDSSIVRFVFAILIFGAGLSVLFYFLLWIILPKKNLDHTITNTKKLYRNPDEKVIAGVASGLASYFNIAVWIPRLIFVLPLATSILGKTISHAIWWHTGSFPSFIFGSFTGTLTIIYIILWAVIPEAITASEKLEMKGEKVDLNSIKNTIQEDLEGFRTRAEKAGKEFSEKAKVWSSDFTQTTNQAGKRFTSEVNAGIIRSTGRIGSVIGIIFKAFFLFVAGTIAFALIMALIAGLIGGASVLPLKDFLIGGFTSNILLTLSLVGFVLVPIVALIVFIVRRTMGIKTKNNYLGAIFAGLWTIGLFAAIMLVITTAKGFKARNRVEENIAINQPTTGKLIIKASNDGSEVYDNTYMNVNFDDDFDNNDNEIGFGISGDSLLVRTVRIGVVKSADSLFHVRLVKFSRGINGSDAKELASHLQYSIKQNDGELVLPDGFAISKKDKYHFQQMLVVIEVPVGKKIEKDITLNRFHSFGINGSRKYGYEMNWDDTWDNNYQWGDNKEFMMTAKGLISKTKESKEDNDNNEDKQQPVAPQKPTSPDSPKYKYEQTKPIQKNDTPKNTVQSKELLKGENWFLRYSI